MTTWTVTRGLPLNRSRGTNATMTVINKARWTAHRERARRGGAVLTGNGFIVTHG